MRAAQTKRVNAVYTGQILRTEARMPRRNRTARQVVDEEMHRLQAEGVEVIGTSVEGLAEIVRFEGRLDKPRRVGDEIGEEVTISIKTVAPDLGPEYNALRQQATKNVRVIIYAAPEKPETNPDQTEMFGEDGPEG